MDYFDEWKPLIIMFGIWLLLYFGAWLRDKFPHKNQSAMEDNRQELYDELNARIRYYLDQLLTGLKNRINMQRKAAFDSSDPGHIAKWQAYKDVFQMIQKEAIMMPPTNLMYEKAKRDHKRKIIEPLEAYVKGFCGRKYDHYQIQLLNSRIAEAIEQAQNFNSQKFITEE